ncbi:MAG: AraC family transcriptional regulator [Lachnospiraceae bacterium]|nr:AraC family transcriptional regulator [Lachnospiraceae bacterium]
MKYLYEYSDILNTPFEAFMFDTLRIGSPVRPHFHHYAEIIYMISGTNNAVINEKEYCLKRGDMLLIYGGDIHSMSFTPGERTVFAGIKFNAARLTVNAGVTPKLSSLLTAARDQGARVNFGGDETKEYDIGSYFTDCVDELDEKRFGYDVAVQARLCLLMLTMMRIWKREGIDFSSLTGHVSEEELSFRNVLEYIDEHLEEGLKVEELAGRCNMSYSHFARKFRELYGQSCKEYIELLRIEKAEELLRFTDQSLNDIGQELGYADCSHFIRMFKKHKGVTPGSLRSGEMTV